MNKRKPFIIIREIIMILLLVVSITYFPMSENTVHAEELQTITEEEVAMADKPSTPIDGVVVLIVVMAASGLVAGYVMNTKKE